jgi:hypothetical protein
MARRSKDPELAALRDQQEQTLAEFERWYTRCKRAFTRMDKVKKKLTRLGRKIEDRLASRSEASEA